MQNYYVALLSLFHLNACRTSLIEGNTGQGQSPLHPTAGTQCCNVLICYGAGRYENVVQIRCLHEGISPEDMLDNWHHMLPHKMKEWGLDRKEVGGYIEGGGGCLGRGGGGGGHLRRGEGYFIGGGRSLV